MTDPSAALATMVVGGALHVPVTLATVLVGGLLDVSAALATVLVGGLLDVSAALAVALLAAGAGLVRRRRRRSLAAQAAHELRGPLQAALLALHGLDGDRARLAAIDLELRRAARAAEDLSAAAAGRRAPDAAAEVDLAGLLADAAVAWELLAADQGVDLAVERPDAPIAVRGDQVRIAQALANLVANAVEHGRGDVRVRARVGERRARVEVTDGGPGLPAPLSNLLAAARGRHARRGHGLALAAAIAHRHGGRLATAPSPRGARLVFEVPLAEAEPVGLHDRLGRITTATLAGPRRAVLAGPPRRLPRRAVSAVPLRRLRRRAAAVVPLRRRDPAAPAARRAP